MSRYLLVGDIHVRLDNFDEIDILLAQVVQVLRQEPNLKIVLLGDILHSFEKVFTQCMNKACEFIKTCASLTTTYILVGNHDYINQYQFQTDQHWMNPLKQWNGVHIIDRATQVDDVLMCPFVPNGRLLEALGTQMNWKTFTRLVLCHQEIKGCKMGTIVSDGGDVWPIDYPQIIGGHIHETQNIGTNVYYPGAPLQHSFGDYQHQRVLCIVEVLPGGAVKKDEIILHVPTKQIHRLGVEELKVQSQGWVGGEKHKVFLTDLTTEQFKLFKKSMEYQSLVGRGVQIHVQPPLRLNVSQGPLREDKAPVSFKEMVRMGAVRSNIVETFQKYF